MPILFVKAFLWRELSWLATSTELSVERGVILAGKETLRRNGAAHLSSCPQDFHKM